MNDAAGSVEVRPPIAVLVVDDHAMVAESIIRRLRDEPDIQVIGAATTATAGLAQAAVDHPDVVLMDFELPDLDGIAATRQLVERSPASRIVLVTGHSSVDLLTAAIEAGCSGYVDKSRTFDELARAIRLAAAGEIVLPAGALSALLPRIARGTAAVAPARLSDREHEVLRLMAQGLVNKTIARRLDLSLNTVRNHVQSVLAKLNVHSKLEAVIMATRCGLVRLDAERAERTGP